MIKESISINNKGNQAFGPAWEKASQSAKELLKFITAWNGEMHRIIEVLIKRNKSDKLISEMAKQCLLNNSTISHLLEKIAKKQISAINIQDMMQQIEQFNLNWKNLKIELGKSHEEYLNFIDHYKPHYFISDNFKEIINEISKLKQNNIENNIKSYYPDENIVRNYILTIANSGIPYMEKYAEIIAKQFADEGKIDANMQEIFSKFYYLLNKIKEERENMLGITEPIHNTNEKRYAIETISLYSKLLSILESVSTEIKNQEKIKTLSEFLNLHKTIAEGFIQAISNHNE